MQTLYQSLVAVEPFTLIVTILNLFLQLYLIKKLFLNKLLGVLDKRRELADKEVTDARSAHQQAMEAKRTYEENLQQAKNQADQILDSAHKAAAARSQTIVGQAKQEAARIKDQAAADIAQQKRKAINDAKEEISIVAMAVAERVVQRQLTSHDQDRLIDDFMRNMEDAL